MPPYFTHEFQRTLRAAEIEAQREGRQSVSPAHLLLAALDCSAATPDGPARSQFAESPGTTAAARVLEALGVEPQLVRLAIQSRLSACPERAEGRKQRAKIKFSPATARVIARATCRANQLKSPHIGTEHIIATIASITWPVFPMGFELIWQLRQWKLVSEATQRALWQRTAPLNTIAPEVMEELNLDAAALRAAVINVSTEEAAGPHWTESLNRAATRAQKEATSTGAGRVGAEHLWLALLADPAIVELLHNRGIAPSTLEPHLRAALRADNDVAAPKIRYTDEARRAFTAARNLALAESALTVGTDHLLLALAGFGRPTTAARRSFLDAEPASRARPAIARAFTEGGFPPNQLQKALSKWTGESESESPVPPVGSLPTDNQKVWAFMAPGLAWITLSIAATGTNRNSLPNLLILAAALGCVPFAGKLWIRSSSLRPRLDVLYRCYYFGWAILLFGLTILLGPMVL